MPTKTLTSFLKLYWENEILTSYLKLYQQKGKVLTRYSE